MRSTLPIAFLFVVTAGHARAELPKICEDASMKKAIFHDLNELPALKVRGFQAVDLLDAKTEAYDMETDAFTCSYLVRWSDSTEGRLAIVISKNSMGDPIIKIVPVAK